MNRDFIKFWLGQTVNNFGTSITEWALPLIVFKLTGSAVGLGVAFAVNGLPYLLFSLPIGAWMDRLDRKKTMITCDLVQGMLVLSIPVLSKLSALEVTWVYAVGFLGSTVHIFFRAGEFAAIPSLVDTDGLVAANGRIQATYSAAQVAGPLAAGLAVTALDVEDFLFVDAMTFVVSAISLIAVRKRFDLGPQEVAQSIMQGMKEGVRYVWGHPVLRSISIMMALVNLIGAPVFAQLVLFAKRQLGATDAQYGLIVAAGSAGVIGLSLLAGPLRKRFSFSVVALGALSLHGALIAAMAMTRDLAVGMALWGLVSGFGILFNINTSSLRQSIVPDRMLGRVLSVATFLAWSAIPLGALLGSLLVEQTGRVDLVFLGIGAATFAVPLLFALGPLGSRREAPNR